MAEESSQKYIYYISNPHIPELHFLEVIYDYDLSEHIKNHDLPYWHIKKPEGIKNPVWSNEANDWVEADENSQGAQLAEQGKQIKSLITDNETYRKQLETKDQEIEDLQTSIATSNRTVGQLGQQFNQFGTQMTDAMSKVTEAVNKLTLSVNKSDADSTDTKEEGDK